MMLDLAAILAILLFAAATGALAAKSMRLACILGVAAGIAIGIALHLGADVQP